MMPIIHCVFAKNDLRNFSYIIHAETGFFIIDPYEATQIKELVGSFEDKLIAIINTHEHHDHIRGNDELVKTYKLPVWAHENAAGKIPGVSRFLKKDERIDLGAECELVVMDTPGHTHAHLCLLMTHKKKPHSVFTGDTLFAAGVGNCHNGGDPEVLFETISQQFMTLPDDVIIYPGHEYMRNNLGFTLSREPGNQEAQNWLDLHMQLDQDNEFRLTRIKNEKEFNTFFRLKEKNIIDGLPQEVSESKQVFLSLRELRNNW